MLAKPQINFRNVGIPTALRGTLSLCLMTKSRCFYYTMWCTNIRLKKSLKSVNVLQSRSQKNLATTTLIFVKISGSTKSALASTSTELFCLALNDRIALVQTLLLSSLLFQRTIFSSPIYYSFLPLCVLIYCYQLVLSYHTQCLLLLVCAYSKCLFTVRHCQPQLNMFFTQPCLCFVMITALHTSTRFYFQFTWTEDAVWRNRFPLNKINAC